MNPLFIQNNPVLMSCILFIVIFTLIQLGKPTCLYNTDGSIRQFGIGYNKKTIFPIWILSIILGILCYLFVRYYILNL
jgi:hypothetical protein